jgi:hypothetical protein
MALVWALGAGCTIKQIPPTTPPLSVVANGKTIVQLPALMLYESVYTGESIDDPPADAAGRGPKVDAGIASRLAQRGISTVVAPASAMSDEFRSQYRLLAGPKRDRSTAIADVRQIAAAVSGAQLALLPLVIMRVGRAGGYDANSGAVWTTTSSTSVRLAVISLQDGQRLWTREAFMRSVANDKDLNRALDVAFQE